MRAYSIDLRKRVLADCDAGLGTHAVAEKYQVSPAIVRRWKQRRRENGELGPRPWNAGRKRKVDRAAVAAAVQAQPDATLRELREALGIDVSLQTIHRILRELKISFKKSPPRRGARPPRRRRAARRVESVASRPRPAEARLPRRNVGQDEHDSAVRSLSDPRASRRQDTARALEDDHVPGRVAPQRSDGPAGDRRGEQRHDLPGLCTPTTGADPAGR